MLSYINQLFSIKKFLFWIPTTYAVNLKNLVYELYKKERKNECNISYNFLYVIATQSTVNYLKVENK